MTTTATFNNGATIIAETRTSDSERVVLAMWRGEYVTWCADNDGEAFWGHYFQDVMAATADYDKRAKLRSASL